MEKGSKKGNGSKKQTSSYTQEENNSMLQELFLDELREKLYEKLGEPVLS